jgi:ABC transport system ATP-binding/permease protein
MSEKILRALMRLFAIIAKADDTTDISQHGVKVFLRQQLNKDQVQEYLAVYEEYLKAQDEGAEGEKKKRRLAVSSVKVLVICDQINEELTQRQKYVVMLNLISFVSAKGSVSDLEMEFLETVSGSFHIPEEEFRQTLQLALKPLAKEIEDSADILLVGPKKDESRGKSKHFHSDSISGDMVVQRVHSVGIYLMRYYGKGELFLNGQIMMPDRVYIFSPGSSIRSSKVQPVYYSDIVSSFLENAGAERITFTVSDLTYKFKNGKLGLHPLSFSETAGRLIGIMGGSGAGKSTLLNILNGNNTPSSGAVLINGHNLHGERKKMEGVIGYVPQDDLLIEELTVYQNLFYNSKLCFNDHSDEQINKLVLSMLSDLGLLETKDLRVGNSLDKTISGGQRKRLNIALELIREPGVLFVDEPTSGLSSRDSENIMDLLKELSLKGKLVFVVIHQPSSDIFKMFDKLLLLDNGGYPIYYGNPVESVIYFKTLISQVNANESECATCGNVNPEQIFNIIEAKVLDENGDQTRNRRISPKEWNEFYLSKIASQPKGAGTEPVNDLHNTFKKPGFLKQFGVFVTRNLLSKLADTQYLLINLLEAPALALILASLVKFYKNGGDYSFGANKNMPAYLFMCVLVALFIGLTVSAEEIIRDRKILKRESFLNLSRGSYLLSKILVLFFISAIQTLSFVLIGNLILGIQDMYFAYWMVLFTTSCCANMLGLNISSSFNSAVTIYILIPILLIPQILLSGVIVKFEELNPKISSQSVVPAIGEMMTSRWAFEALAVNQFINNRYERDIYPYEKEMSNSGFKKVYWYAKMNSLTDECVKDGNGKAIILRNEISDEMKNTPQFTFASLEKIHPGAITKELGAEIKSYLQQVKKFYAERYDKAARQKDEWLSKFQESEESKRTYEKLSGEHQNSKITDLVKNVASDLEEVEEENGRLIATTDPIFREGPGDRFIRAHFLAPTKNVFGRQYGTYWVNVLVIWFMSLVLGVTLYFDALRKLLEFFDSMFSKFRRKAPR